MDSSGLMIHLQRHEQQQNPEEAAPLVSSCKTTICRSRAQQTVDTSPLEFAKNTHVDILESDVDYVTTGFATNSNAIPATCRDVAKDDISAWLVVSAAKPVEA